MNATKRPLLTVRHDTENDETHIVREGEPIATIWRTQPDYEEFADQFVRAVNSYAAMREALEEIIRNVEPWKTADNMAGRLHEIASNALALAKGQ